MEIKPEKKGDRRLRFLWLLLLANLVLIFGIWQYHRLLVEISDGAVVGVYQRLFRRGSGDGSLAGRSLRVALLRSEATAVSFGEDRAGYYNLIELWRQLLEREEFGYQIVDTVPMGEEAERFNLLLLPAARSLSERERQAVKRFLRSGKGVVMTWATGTRDEYGQWQRYSLLQEVAGIDLAESPPVHAGDRVSTVLLSGGYPLTANLYPGISIRITAFDQPVAGIVRESRTRIDGVWTDPDDPSYALHSMRDRAAVAHGTYFDGRFAWLGFTIGSAQLAPEQQESFATLLRSSLLWAGRQVHAFKPVWPDGRRSLAAISQDVVGPEDVDADILATSRRYRIPLSSFVHPHMIENHADLVLRLAEMGEVGVLLDADGDYAGLTQLEQQRMFAGFRKDLEAITGIAPAGLRIPKGTVHSEATLDAAVRAGYLYISTSDIDRMVPKPVRSYRPVRIVTRPRTLWLVPKMPYVATPRTAEDQRNTMLAHFSQVASLGGFYCLSFRPSEVDEAFAERLDSLLQAARRNRSQLSTVQAVTELWQGWDHVKLSVRHLSEDRAALRISNTWTENVRDIVINVEMPYEQRDLQLESMTLGTRLPDRMTSSGVRWQLHLEDLRAGKNVAYYLNVDRSQRARATRLPVLPGDVDRELDIRPEVW